MLFMQYKRSSAAFSSLPPPLPPAAAAVAAASDYDDDDVVTYSRYTSIKTASSPSSPLPPSRNPAPLRSPFAFDCNHPLAPPSPRETVSISRQTTIGAEAPSRFREPACGDAAETAIVTEKLARWNSFCESVGSGDESEELKELEDEEAERRGRNDKEEELGKWRRQREEGEGEAEAEGMRGRGSDEEEAKGVRRRGSDEAEAKGMRERGWDEEEAEGVRRRGWDEEEAEGVHRRGSEVSTTEDKEAVDGGGDGESSEEGGQSVAVGKAVAMAKEEEEEKIWRTIEFRIISAQDLKKVRGRRMQTYAVAYVAEEEEEAAGEMAARTQVDGSNGRNPVWNEVLRLRLRREMLRRQPLACLTIDVYCKSWLPILLPCGGGGGGGRRRRNPDHLLGSARIFLSDVLLTDDGIPDDGRLPPCNPIRCRAFWLRLPSGDRPHGFLNVWFPPSGRFFPPFPAPAPSSPTATSSSSSAAESSS